MPKNGKGKINLQDPSAPHLKQLGLSPSCANQTFFQIMNWGREIEVVVESSSQTQNRAGLLPAENSAGS